MSNHCNLGLDKWKREIKSPDYDWELIKARLDQLREIRHLNKGQSAMIFALRTSLARNIGDMGNPKVRPLYILFLPQKKQDPVLTDYFESFIHIRAWEQRS